MSSPNDLYCNRGETREGDQEFVYNKQRFTISEVVLTEEFLVTEKNTPAGNRFLFTINEIYYKRGCTKWNLLFVIQNTQEIKRTHFK